MLQILSVLCCDGYWQWKTKLFWNLVEETWAMLWEAKVTVWFQAQGLADALFTSFILMRVWLSLQYATLLLLLFLKKCPRLQKNEFVVWTLSHRLVLYTEPLQHIVFALYQFSPTYGSGSTDFQLCVPCSYITPRDPAARIGVLFWRWELWMWFFWQKVKRQ